MTPTKEERETVKSYERVTKTCVAASKPVSDLHVLDAVILRSSSLKMIANVTALLLRLRGRVGAKRPSLRFHKFDTKSKADSNPVTASEHADAMKILIEHAQKELDITKYKGFSVEIIKTERSSGKHVELVTLKSRVKNFTAKKFFETFDPRKNLRATTILFYNKHNTLVKETQNKGPIGLKPSLQTATEYLSPNSLLLGRCSDRIISMNVQVYMLRSQSNGSRKYKLSSLITIVETKEDGENECSEGDKENAELGKPGECKIEDDIQCPPIPELQRISRRQAAEPGCQ